MPEKQVDGTSTTISGLDPTTEYHVTVKAVDATGNESLPSNTIEVTTEPAGPTVIDDFEDGNMDEYSQVGQGEGVTTDFSYNGSAAFSADNQGKDLTLSNPGDGLPAYFTPGNRLSFWVHFTDASVDWRFLWGFGDGTSYNGGAGYEMCFSSINSRMEVTDGGDVFVEDNGYSPPSAAWLNGVIEWGTDGSITCEVYDTDGNLQSSMSGTNTTHSGGGIGFGGREGGTYTIDYITLEGL